MEREPKLRRRVDLTVLFFLIGLLVIAFAVVMVVSGYVDRLHTAMAPVKRIDAIQAYPGRPAEMASDGERPMNYLLLVGDSDDDLYASVVMNLSSDRHKLTLLVLPPNVTAEGKFTLGEAFTTDPALVWRNVELLTGTRMDHQLIIMLDEMDGVIRALDGLALTADSEPIEASKLNGWVSSALNENERAYRIAEVIRALLSHLWVQDALADPDKYEEVVKNLAQCMVVDSDLSSDEIWSMVMELRVNPDEIEALFIPDTNGSVADAPRVGSDNPSSDSPASSDSPGSSVVGTEPDPILSTSAPAAPTAPTPAPEATGIVIEAAPSVAPTVARNVIEVDSVTVPELRAAFRSEDFSLLR